MIQGSLEYFAQIYHFAQGATRRANHELRQAERMRDAALHREERALAAYVHAKQQQKEQANG